MSKAPSFSARYGGPYSTSTSFVDRPALSFGGGCSRQSSTVDSFTRNNKPVSMQYKLSDGPPTISDADRIAKVSDVDIAMKSYDDRYFSRADYWVNSPSTVTAAKVPTPSL
ncbi:hypothetical protein Tco_0463780, partial [Tanacetum coccineum]